MKINMDPYRYFFPAGWLLGFWGVLLWILFPWGLISYPGLQHPDIMMGGFFLCFVCGFLMTAAPKFTSTFAATNAEHIVSWILIVLLLAATAFFERYFFFAAVLLIFIFLGFFVIRRFRQRKSDPPESFVFLGFGLATGFFGSGVLFICEFLPAPGVLQQVGRILFLQTYIMCLVIGVGSRLVPALLGFSPLPNEAGEFKKTSARIYVLLGVGFVASYLVEALFSMHIGYCLRTLILTYLFLRIWTLYRLPERKAVQTFGLWLSAWAVLIGHAATLFFPDYRVALLHIILISGLSLMTLMIAVRVTLSHGKHAMSLERNSKALGVAAFLLFLAGLTRLSAHFAPSIYQSHLLYAAIVWILGLLIWGVLFIPKMIRVNS